MKWSGVVAVISAVSPWIQVVWGPVARESGIWKFEEANFLVIVGFLVGW
jgi:hypothetical protein